MRDIGGDRREDAEPPRRGFAEDHPLPGEAPRDHLSCQAHVPRELVLFVSGLLAARRREIRTQRHPQAGLLPAGAVRPGLVPRQGRRPAARRRLRTVAATAYRYRDEVTGRARGAGTGTPRRHVAALQGTPFVILDGKVVASDRCREKTRSRKGREIDLWYSGKTHDFGGNVQAPGSTRTASRCGCLMCSRGNVHDLAAAREKVLAVLRPFLDVMPALADPRVRRRRSRGPRPGEEARRRERARH